MKIGYIGASGLMGHGMAKNLLAKGQQLVTQGDATRGHRFMAPDAIPVRRFEDYEAKLLDSKVVLDPERRKDPGARAEMLNAADAVILCLPDDAAKEAVKLVVNDRTVIIDASTAFRVDPAWVYGFPEMVDGHRVLIQRSKRISNPGCYPTGFIGITAPLVRAGLIPAETPITVNAVSGYTGGGKGLIEEFQAQPSEITNSPQA